jgi:hypothetical protein
MEKCRLQAVSLRRFEAKQPKGRFRRKEAGLMASVLSLGRETDCRGRVGSLAARCELCLYLVRADPKRMEFAH